MKDRSVKRKIRSYNIYCIKAAAVNWKLDRKFTCYSEVEERKENKTSLVKTFATAEKKTRKLRK